MTPASAVTSPPAAAFDSADYNLKVFASGMAPKPGSSRFAVKVEQERGADEVGAQRAGGDAGGDVRDATASLLAESLPSVPSRVRNGVRLLYRA